MNINNEIIETIYDVPLGSSNWQDVVQKIRDEFQASVGLMMIDRPNQPPMIVSSLMAGEDDQLKAYDEYYYSIDPWNELLTSDKLAPNTCYPGYIINQDKSYYRKEYYNDFWKPHGFYHTCGGILSTNNNISVIFGFPREKAAGAYELEESVLMTLYGRHVAKAIELEGAFGNSLPSRVYQDALSASFGMTSAESRLVLELFRACSLPEAAKNLKRSYHTVRNQMKSILKKTGTTNQLELFIRLAKG